MWITVKLQPRVIALPSTIYFLTTQKNEAFPCIERHFPNHVLFSDQWKKIADEYISYSNSLSDQGKMMKSMFDTDPVNVYAGLADSDRKWKMVMLKHSDRFTDQADYFPETKKWLQQCPEIARAMFSVFEGKTTLKPHHALSKTVIRYLLGLIVPTDPTPYLIVDGIKREFGQGKEIFFDDTHTHTSVNPNSQQRVVLFLDINRKTKSKLIQRLVRWENEKVAQSKWWKKYNEDTEKKYSLN